MTGSWIFCVRARREASEAECVYVWVWVCGYVCVCEGGGGLTPHPTNDHNKQTICPTQRTHSDTPAARITSKLRPPLHTYIY